MSSASESTNVPRDLWPAPGDVLAGAWRLRSIDSNGEAARAVVFDGSGREVALLISPAAKDGRRGPLESGGAQVYYEKTPVPLDAFIGAARALAERATSKSPGRDLAGAVRAWLRDRPVVAQQRPSPGSQQHQQNQQHHGQQQKTFRLGRASDFAPMLEEARRLPQDPPVRVRIVAEQGAAVSDVASLVRVVRGGRDLELTVTTDVLTSADDLRILAESAGSLRLELRVAANGGPRAREVMDAAKGTQLRPEVVIPLRGAAPPDLQDLSSAARALASPGGSFIVVELPEADDLAAPLSELVRAIDQALGPESVIRRRIRSRAGTPLCVVRSELARVFGDGPGEQPQGPAGTFAPGCESCALRPACGGVSPAYAARFGTGEVVPLPSQGPRPKDLREAISAIAWQDRVRLQLTNRPGATMTLGEVIPPDSLPKWPCILPWTRLELDEYNKFGPCCTQYQLRPGRVLEDFDVRAMWQSPAMKAYRRAMTGAGHPDPCRPTCPILAGQTQRPQDFRFHGGPATTVENQILLIEEMLAGKEELASAPLGVVFQTTTFCNYKCLMCEYGERGTLNDERPESFYRGLETWLDKLADIDVTGGEPLASPVFRAFLERLDGDRYPQLRVNLVTNGSYLTPKQQDRWEKVRFGQLIVSLNAATPETYLAVNRGLAYERVRENLDALLARRRAGRLDAAITYSMVILKQNRHEIGQFAELALEDGVNLRFMLPFGNRNDTSIMTERSMMEETRANLASLADDYDRRGYGWVARDLRGNVRVLEERLQQPILRVL